MYKNAKRMMAWVAKIDNVVKHPDADSLDICTVGGWQCVTKLGEFKPGDLAVYISIDSWVPTNLAPFLSKGKEPKEYNGVRGERLRTVKLRGQLSQGLLLPVDEVNGTKFITGYFLEDGMGSMVAVKEGDDVTEALGIQKWETPIPAQLAGQVRGNFPTVVPKTDQERIQNLKKEFEEWKAQNLVFEVTEKLDGSSCTMYLDLEGDFHVCSRNLDLKRDENNSFWKAAIQGDVENRMVAANLHGFAIQGELIGEGIQGNQYKIRGHKFYAFDIYDTKAGAYLNSEQRIKLCQQLGLNHAPLVGVKAITAEDIASILQEAEGKSLLNDSEREGLVWKCISDPSISFKTISNRWLLKNKE
jgi:RNA ligase (TIGR02306 family)